jgi:hypothetical protein
MSPPPKPKVAVEAIRKVGAGRAEKIFALVQGAERGA